MPLSSPVIGNSVIVYSHALKTHPALGIGFQSEYMPGVSSRMDKCFVAALPCTTCDLIC